MALTSEQAEENALARYRLRLLDQANAVGIDLALLRGEDAEEEWEYLEGLVEIHYKELNRRGEKPPRLANGKLRQSLPKHHDGG